jgi:hypothetical protein
VTDVARLRALLAATPADWTWEEHGNGWAIYAGRDDRHHGLNLLWSNDFDARGKDTRALIAEAVNALPALLDEVEALRAATALLASVCLGCGQRDGRVDEDGLCTLCGGAVVVSHRGDVEAIEEYRAEMSARIDSLQNERDEARALVDAMSLTGPMDWTDGGGRG